MSVLQSVVIALACFSRIPMPFVAWDERNMRYMMAAFPLVGACVGAALALWWQLCAAISVGPVLRAAGIALIPLAITGGIHLDGFADVVDAESSHATPERKRQIMKDPHVGAFAVAGICAYLLSFFALATELDARFAGLLACVPVVSRCLVGMAAVSWPLASDTGMLASVVRPANRRVTLLALLVELATAVLVGGSFCAARAGAAGIVATVASVGGSFLVWARVGRLSKRDFGGMSGDLAGYGVQTIELAMLACLVLAGKLV